MGFQDFTHFRKQLDKDFSDVYGDKADAHFHDFLQHALLFFSSLALRDFETDPPGKPVPPYLSAIRSFFSKVLEREVPWACSPQFLASRCLLHMNYQHYNKIEFASPSLDLGCGRGETANLCLDGAKWDIGTDLTHPDLVTCREFGNHGMVVAADARKLPFSDDSFQSVMCNYTLCHIGNNKQVFEEVSRVMKPGGWFYFDYVSPAMHDLKDRPFGNLAAHLGSKKLRTEFKEMYHSCYDSDNSWDTPLAPEKMCAQLEELGFTNVSYDYFFAKETMQAAYFFFDMAPFLQQEFTYDSKPYKEFVFERLARVVNLDRELCKERNEGNFIFYKAQKK